MLNIKKPHDLLWFYHKIQLTSLLHSFSLLLLILSLVFGQKTFNYDQRFIYNTVTSVSMMIFFSLLITILLIKLKNNSQVAYQREIFVLVCSSIFLPFVTFISLFVFKFYLKNIAKSNLLKTEQWTAFTILFSLLIVVVFIIWIYYFINGPIKNKDGEYLPVPGILDAFYAPVIGFINSADLIIFLLVVGSFIFIVNKTHALEKGIGKLVAKMHNREIYALPILIFIFGLGGMSFGMCEETLPFYLILSPILLAAGFDVMTTFLTILLGAGVGTAGSILNPFVIQVSIEAMNKAGVENISFTDGILYRILMWFSMLTFTCIFVVMYARKVKADITKSIVYDLHQEHIKAFPFSNKANEILTTRDKWTIGIFISAFVIMVSGIISWEQITGWDGFSKFHQQLAYYFPFLFSHEDGIFGHWSFGFLTIIFFIGTLIVSIINWKNEKQFIDDFINGARDFLSIPFIIGIAFGISHILGSSGLNILITDNLNNIVSQMNSIVAGIAILFTFLLLSFLITSTSGFAGAVFPIISPTLAANHISLSGTISTFSLANGFVNFFSPSSMIFVSATNLSKIPIDRYYKVAWKFLLFIIVYILVMTIGMYAYNKGLNNIFF